MSWNGQRAFICAILSWLKIVGGMLRKRCQPSEKLDRGVDGRLYREDPESRALAPRPAPLRATRRGGPGGSGLGFRRADLGKIITWSQADGHFRGFPSPVPTTYR